MIVEHRPFKESDAPAICSFPRSADELFFIILQAAYPFPLAPDQFAAAVSRCHDPIVGICDSRIAGYVNFVEVHPKKFCSIGNLVVHPEFRRHGIGAYLVGTMVQMAIDRYAVRFVRASCLSHNNQAYALYHKLGFRPAAMGQRLGPDGDPVLVIHLHLHKRDWKGLRPRQDPACG